MANNNNRFTGVHSKIMINLDQVIYAESEGHVQSDVIVHCVYPVGIMVLSGEDARLFLKHWRNDEGHIAKD